MLELLCLACLMSAGWPVHQAIRREYRTPLLPTTLWLGAAWVTAMLVPLALLLGAAPLPWIHLNLTLISCTTVSVLGARRPGVGAWNFVTFGLLSVLLLPLLQQLWSLDTWSLDAIWPVLLGGVIAIGAVNYLATRWGVAALLTSACLYGCLISLAMPGWSLVRQKEWIEACYVGLAVGCWWAWATLARRQPPRTAADALWLDFRDRYGLVWAWRVQDQFNLAARNQGLATELRWSGVQASAPHQDLPGSAEELLRAVLKRFGESPATH
jgi:hypothetical protein